MTSTSTFQGMDSETKPSSRVLAPPGGGSSNIFGTPTPVKPAPPKETAPAQPAQPAPSQPAPSQPAAPQASNPERNIRSAPKQGEDSFQNLFGSAKDVGLERSKQNATSKIDKSHNCSNNSSPSTFNCLFGQPQTEERKKSASSRHSNSFNSLFGDRESKTGSHAEAIGPEKNLENLSLRDSCSPQCKPQSRDTVDSSFHRVFGEFQGNSTPSRSKHQADSNAYNPITGEPYDKPQTKKMEASSGTEAVAADGNKGEEKENDQSVGVKANPAATAEAVKPSTRVVQPPGGKSSGLW